MRASTKVYFATSSDSKFAEADLVLAEFGLKLGRLRTKGKELQSDDVAVVASAAAAELATRHHSPFFVEDTGLFVKSLGGFPGAYASFVNRTIGPGGLLRLMAGHSERSAEFVGAVAYVEGSRRPRVFVGRLKGNISLRARGRHGFGFDPVFVPEGSNRTLGELSLKQKCLVSHRSRALRAFGEWLVSHKIRESL
jgi:XTP/dITP diphosphohydrolase